MDFKSLISKLDSMDAPPQTPAAPVLEKAVQLNEDAQLRVLSGRTTYVAEAKKKAEDDVKEKEDEEKSAKKESVESDNAEISEVFDADDPVGTKKKTQHGTATKTATGVKHERGATDADSDDEDDEPKTKKKAKKESIDPEVFKSKFLKMVEAVKKDEKKVKGKKAEDKMDESAKPDFLDIDGDGDKKEPMKKAASEKGSDKKDGKKGMSAKQAKYFGKKNESAMMPKGKKRPVKESIEPKLSFKEMIKLVHESGGQQAIDPTDKALFAWATRVAQTKFQESRKAEVYAGLVYERMGGVFEMYDVLSETKK